MFFIYVPRNQPKNNVKPTKGIPHSMQNGDSSNPNKPPKTGRSKWYKPKCSLM